jgi:hypothetical protein
MSKHKCDQDFIRSIVEQVLTEKYTPQPVIVDGIELTPEPSPGRKRKYVRSTITVDEKLWDLVQQECKRLQILPPRLIDSLLWLHFGKPTLSYQEEKEDLDHDCRS